MFGMSRSLTRVREALDLAAAEAIDHVIIDHAGGLHERIANGRADEAEAARLEIATEHARGVRHRGHLTRRAPAVLDRLAVDVPPEPGVERALRALHGEERARVDDRRQDLGAIAHDALVAQQHTHARAGEARNGARIEPCERAAISVAPGENRGPGPPGPRALDDGQPEPP